MKSEVPDVLIIGAGVSGLSCGLALMDAGRSVQLVERERAGAGASHGNCGLITPSHAMPLCQPGMLKQALKWMLKADAPVYIKPRLSLDLLLFGWRFQRASGPERVLEIAKARALLLQHSRTLYPTWLEQHGIECQWQAGGQLLALATEQGAEHELSMHPELREWGIEVESLSGAEAVAREPCLRPGLAAAAYYPGDAHLRPDSLVRELARVLRERGARLDEGCEVRDLLSVGKRVSGVRLADGRELRAEHVVLASGAWAPQLGRSLGLDLPIQAGRGYSITLEPSEPSPRLPLILEEAAMGVTPWADGLRLGGSMEFTGLCSDPSPARFEALLEGARRFLTLEPKQLGAECWSGQRAMTPDELPLIGATGKYENLHIASGHGRMGVSMAPSTGQLIMEGICGLPASLDPAPYSPKRFAKNR